MFTPHRNGRVSLEYCLGMRGRVARPDSFTYSPRGLIHERYSFSQYSRRKYQDHMSTSNRKQAKYNTYHATLIAALLCYYQDSDNKPLLYVLLPLTKP
jgi:hypothetical protein